MHWKNHAGQTSLICAAQFGSCDVVARLVEVASGTCVMVCWCCVFCQGAADVSTLAGRSRSRREGQRWLHITALCCLGWPLRCGACTNVIDVDAVGVTRCLCPLSIQYTDSACSCLMILMLSTSPSHLPPITGPAAAGLGCPWRFRQHRWTHCFGSCSVQWARGCCRFSRCECGPGSHPQCHVKCLQVSSCKIYIYRWFNHRRPRNMYTALVIL